MSLRALPAIHRLLADPGLSPYASTLGAGQVKAALDAVLDEARAAIARGAEAPSAAEIVGSARERLTRAESGGLLEILNGTGVLLHTNLGRAPLAGEALEAIARFAAGYSNLEYDLESGARGSRYARVTDLLRAASGAEDALVVNNCAAALMLVIDTFSRGRETIAARGELVEIGGGLRLPELVQRSLATLVEVGTTNRTYVADYERALSPRTALLMRSHTSNYRIEGFTAGVSALELAELGRRVGVTTFEDLGTGALLDLSDYGLPREPTVRESVAAGLDLIAFSGDKLLGGPQAGIIVGRAALVARMRSNPLLRALRVDKATLAALAATLRLYEQPGGVAKIPLYAMLSQTPGALRQRADAIVAELGECARFVRVTDSKAFTGGGTLPQADLPSIALAVHTEARDPDALAQRLRAGRPAIVGRAEAHEVLIDLRSISPASDGLLAASLARALTPA